MSRDIELDEELIEQVAELRTKMNGCYQEAYLYAHELINLLRPIAQQSREHALALGRELQDDDLGVVRFIMYNIQLSHNREDPYL